ncbi:MAG: sulfatase-like hydrolase/transferase [Opitutaceae bacterium]|jgi:arylsulfatase A|nr:sulfatase-like hydrolase/transferase [Opitutaceae bacterium]
MTLAPGLIILAGALLLPGAASVIAAGAPLPPSFLVILADDQSWAGTSQRMIPGDPASASDYHRTPRIEQLAARGMLFTDGYAPAPYCCPTRRSLQVGQTPARHEYQRDREGWPADYRRRLNIPRLLKAADARYRAAHFGKWDHRYDGISPADQGFDESDGVTGNNTGGGRKAGGEMQREDPKLMSTLTERAGAFMAEQARAGRPFFLQVSHYAVHLEIQHSPAAMTRVRGRAPGIKHNLDVFAAMTEDLDDAVGRLLDRLEALGLAERTYVVYLSDNGGRPTLPGAADRGQGPNFPLRGAKGTLYEGGIRVPFIVAGPGIKAGSVSRVPVTGLDLLPTFADLAGYRSPLPANLDGGSLREVWHNGGVGEVRRPRPYLLFHQAVDRRAQTALRWGDLKLVKNWTTGEVELFDLARDPRESENLARLRPEKTAELHRLATAFIDEVKAETRQLGKIKDD